MYMYKKGGDSRTRPEEKNRKKLRGLYVYSYDQLPFLLYLIVEVWFTYHLD